MIKLLLSFTFDDHDHKMYSWYVLVIAAMEVQLSSSSTTEKEFNVSPLIPLLVSYISDMH